ncbi:MAG: AAA family ATPase [Candidatus Pacearchaeota archaeon]
MLQKLSFRPFVIGVIGTIASGKDSVSNYLVKRYGFKKIVMSNFLRAEARKRKIKPTRDNLRKLQHELRARYGEDYLVNKAIELIKTKDHMSMKNVVIDGLRTTIDIGLVKKELGAKIIMVDAKPFVRFMRAKKRGRKGDSTTYEQFLHQEAIESATFNFHKSFKMADFKIDNSGSLKDMERNVDGVMRKIRKNWKEKIIRYKKLSLQKY